VVGEAVRNFVLNTKMSGGKIALGSFFLSAAGKDENGHFRDVVVKVGDLGGAGGQGTAGLERGKVVVAREAWIDLSADGETLYLRLRGMRDAAGAVNLPGTGWLSVNLRSVVQEGRSTADEDLSSSQLLAMVYHGIHDEPNGARFTVHRRACFALMPALFAPIGFCMGVLSGGRGRMTAVLLAVIPMMLFYGCVLSAPTLVRVLDWPAVAWLPAAVVAVLGIPFCWRLLRI
jgi:lipopolysaccharide export LptBFGC system permease protein LptF